MKVEQIYTGCLAKAAYYIESNGEVVIIDPLKNTDIYLEKAATDNAKIKYLFETHLRNSSVSSLLDLADKTGATIVYGPNAQADFEAYIAKDNEELEFGDVSIKVIHTPGHTMESTTYLLKDENGKEHAIFTGDTLFLGDLGETVLTVKEGGIIRKDLAGLLFDSLRNKIMPLADDIIVYPGHGVRSACGKKMFSESSRTLGKQKRVNYALRPDMTKAEFVKKITSALVESPTYKFSVKNLNVDYNASKETYKKAPNPLNVRAFKAAWEMEEALVLDTRTKARFAKGFIPGSIFMGLGGSFSACITALIKDLNWPILFIAEPGCEEEVIARLAKLGYKNIIGYLENGFETWKKAGEQIDKVQGVRPIVFSELFKRKNLNVLDVSKKSERKKRGFEGVAKFPLCLINKNMNLINRGEKHYFHSENGYRSLVAISILKARGIHDVVNVKDGFIETSKLYRKRVKNKQAVLHA